MNDIHSFTTILTQRQVHAHPGKSAPVTTEGIGAVASDSLAADSIRSGGGFTSNVGATPGSGPAATPHASKPGTSGKAGANNPDSLANQTSYAGLAPSYVSSHGQKSESQPGGRSLTEGGFSGSGTAGGRLPEPGSARDPARETVRGIVDQSGGGGGERGTRKRADEQPFKALGGDAEA